MNDKVIYYDDIRIGDKVISNGRTVTETDVVNFAGLSGDYNSLHVDAEYAKKSIIGERLAHGLLGLAFATGLFTRTEFNARMSPALLAFKELTWKFKRPIRIGDTVHVVVEVIHKKEPKPDRGDVVFKRSLINQKDEIVQEGETVLLLARKNT